jgi:outer membrane phospholipase A
MGVLTPQIIIRMYQERSSPVRTPSYMPQITLYYRLKNKSNLRTQNLFIRFAHHSNGQDGDFYLENGELNLKSGDFATNYFESGIIITNVNKRLNAYQFFKTSVEIHPPGSGSTELDGIYSKVRWHTAASIFKLPNNSKLIANKGNASISLKGEATWMFGNVNNWDWISSDRLNLTFTFYYHPKFLEDIGLFVQYYHGLDYYNMYFSHRLEILRFGFMTEKLRF